MAYLQNDMTSQLFVKYEKFCQTVCHMHLSQSISLHGTIKYDSMDLLPNLTG